MGRLQPTLSQLASMKFLRLAPRLSAAPPPTPQSRHKTKGRYSGLNTSNPCRSAGRSTSRGENCVLHLQSQEVKKARQVAR